MAKRKRALKKVSAKALKKRRKASRARKPGAVPLLDSVHRAKVKVIGVGGGGGHIVSEISSRAQRFDFVAANTDKQALKELSKKVKSFSFGQDLTGGLGCGMDAELGERAAQAAKDKIKRLLEGSDICIFIATLGGGTGSGAVETFAKVAQELRVLCLGIFTMPFGFEGEKRKQIAQAALEKVKPLVQAYVIIPNESIFSVIEQKTPLREALSAVNRRLAGTLQGFMDMLALPGLINIDFADVRSILEGRGRLAFINSAEASGAAKAQEAVQAVLMNPLYSYTIEGADRMLFNVAGDRNLKMEELAQISSSIAEYNSKARIIFGVACNARQKDRLKVTLFAVGCRELGERRPGTKKKKTEKGGPLEKPKAEKQEQGTEKPEMPEKVSADKQEAPKGRARKQKSGSKKAKPKERKGRARKARVRRNALDIKRAVDEELKELEEKEKAWDIPAFLRNKE